MRTVCTAVKAFLTPALKQFIWHNQIFRVKLSYYWQTRCYPEGVCCHSFHNKVKGSCFKLRKEDRRIVILYNTTTLIAVVCVVNFCSFKNNTIALFAVVTRSAGLIHLTQQHFLLSSFKGPLRRQSNPAISSTNTEGPVVGFVHSMIVTPMALSMCEIALMTTSLVNPSWNFHSHIDKWCVAHITVP